MSRQRFRDSDPVEEILRIAIQNQGGGDALLRQRLLSTASELGISEEAALQAEKQWLETRKQEEELDEYRSHVRRELMAHAGVYLVINAILVIISLLTSSYFWAIWPILGWGIGLGSHAVIALLQLQNPGGDEFERWRRRRARKGDKSPERTHGLEGFRVNLEFVPPNKQDQDDSQGRTTI
ncbi:MAG: hypothetical protein QOJ65_321 [Fimbriimonadaceae bacterium]|jgi:hypothetical protein|nr:hypothetical protein [Fimbriimonadaceae bacterium]